MAVAGSKGRIAWFGAAFTLFIAATLFVPATPAHAVTLLAPVNPVRVDLDGHPANTGFLTFVEGDVLLNADESEGTLALGGNLSFGTTYNVAADLSASRSDSTFSADGDARADLPVRRWRDGLDRERIRHPEGPERRLHQDRR